MPIALPELIFEIAVPKLFLTHSPRDLDFFFSRNALGRLAEQFEIILNPGSDPLSDADLLRLAPDVDILVSEWSTGAGSEYFENNSNLKAFVRCGVEMLNVDFDAATKSGVLVLPTPAQFAQSVAEFTIGAMFALARGYQAGYENITSGRMTCAFNDGVTRGKFAPEYPGFELASEVLGIVGLGAIGRRLAQLATGLGLKCIAHDPFVRDVGSEVQLVSMNELLKRSRFVSLHCALTPDTRYLMGSAALEQMRSGAFLVNTARGALVDAQALKAALEEKIIAGAAIDAFEEEPGAFSANALLSAPNVLLTPHIAGATLATVERQADYCASICLDLLAGRIPCLIRNPEVLTSGTLRFKAD